MTPEFPHVLHYETDPDRCGQEKQIHFVFRHKDKTTGEYEEKHLKNSPAAKTDS
jgi:calnexin